MNTNTLQAIFDSYGNLVYKICFRYAKNFQDAEDLAQDVFLKIQKQPDMGEYQSKPISWIYRVAVNHCLDVLQENQRRNRLRLANLHRIIVPNYQNQAETCLARLSVDKILSETDCKTREALFLSYTKGMSHEDIGSVLGVSRVAITRRITRFKVKTRKKRLARMETYFCF
jgi:RNA polymerase sigma-70 factor (ECF subfamily)